MNTTIHKIIDLAIELSDVDNYTGLSIGVTLYLHAPKPYVDVHFCIMDGRSITSSYLPSSWPRQDNDHLLEVLEQIKHYGFRDEIKKGAAA